MTNVIRREFLDALRGDGKARAQLVEDLRAASALLTETAIEGQLDEAMRIRVAHTVAGHLLDAAQRLCEHVRTSADGRCRYCLTLMLGEDR
ncbi:MAG TPA: hypothetical protein VK550_16625 [Polyangiaceae bacterium]|nr:hypothetical protein [Polyangiaceae bacterium]